MAVSSVQKAEIETIIQVLTDATAPRRKRKLAEMFLDLPDADAYPEYYEARASYSLDICILTQRLPYM